MVASAEGREFLKRQSAQRTPKNPKGSPLVRKLSRIAAFKLHYACLDLISPERGRSPTARELGIKRF